MIKRDDIELTYAGSPDQGVILKATLLYQSEFLMSGVDDQENVFRAEKMMFDMLDNIYGEIRESLIDILEEYQMRHSGHKAGQNKLQGMIEELIARIPR